MEKEKQGLLADLSLLLVAIIWGSGFIVIKNALDFIDPIYMTFLRFTMASIVMGIIFFKNMRKMKMDDLKAGIIIGIFMFLAFITQTIGLKYTTPGKQAFLTASNVVIVPFLLWFLIGDKPGKFDVIAAILCFAGIGVLSLDDTLTMGYGDRLTLICAVFFALHMISIGKFSKEHDPIVLSVVQFGVVGLLSFIACLVMKIPFKPLDMDIVKSISYMGIVTTIIAFGIQNVAQKYVTSTHAALILSLESVFGALFSILVGIDKMNIQFLIGCIAIFIAIIIAETKLNFIFKEK